MTNDTLDQQIAALKAEISNLDKAFETQMTELGLTLEDLKAETLLDNEYGPKMLEIAQEAAKRAGQERVAHYTAQAIQSAPLPGAGRKGAVRL